MSNLTSIPHGPNTNPYAIFNKLRQAGWRHDFDTSPGNNLIITVDGAPPIGSHPGGVLFAGCWTRQDGLSVFQRSNMDRSITTVVIDPYGSAPAQLPPCHVDRGRGRDRQAQPHLGDNLMDNPDYRIVIELRDVAVGDATSLAQDIWDNHAIGFDAKAGDFEVNISKVEGNFSSNVDWQPYE